MGKNNLKKLKESRRKDSGRDFKTMSEQLLSSKEELLTQEEEKKKYRDESKNDEQPKKRRLKSLFNDFFNSMNNILDEVKETLPDNIFINMTENKRKISNGVVSVTISFAKDNPDAVKRNSTIDIYYTENQTVTYTDSRKLNNYFSHIQVIVKESGNVLFTRFGYDTIIKSEEYIKTIINKSVKFISALDSHDTAEKIDDTPSNTEEQHNSDEEA